MGVKSLLKISKKPASAWVRSLAGLRRICWSHESSSSGQKYPDGLLGRGGSRGCGTFGRSSGCGIAFSSRRSNDFFFDRLNNGSDDRVRNHLDTFRNNEVGGVQGRAGFHLGEVNGNEFRQIALAGKQAAAKIKSEIASMIVAKATAAGVKEAALDPAFIKEMLLAVAGNWNGADAGKVELKALLPEAERTKLDAAFGKSARELLAAGIEVGYSKEVKSGFKVGAKDGGYYISFSDADFDALLGEYLREKVSDMLFKA